ncbi:hypothetical protein HW555_003173 [Spodoptera exigua]|uniref:ATP-dependent DNA helicase n=1 Tax=Spodoptera exigua TaxID=7107 RepID=A0A835L8Q0_SPOEX|nr:hypothetical protein HW555_003173 [Spodoptera exigua]
MLGLTEFTMLFEPFYDKKPNKDKKRKTEASAAYDAYVQSNVRRQLITLFNNSKMAVRNISAVARVPYFIVSSDPENFFYSLLLQYKSIKNQLNSDKSRDNIFVTGGAGTEKTFLFNLVKNQKDGVIVTIPLLTGNYLRMMRQQWLLVEFLFLDELSMVPNEVLCITDYLLRQLKNPNTCVRGINVLLLGDVIQLPPVRGHQVFQQPEHMMLALYGGFKLVELKENMRQQEDTTFIDILNALRIVFDPWKGHMAIAGVTLNNKKGFIADIMKRLA